MKENKAKEELSVAKLVRVVVIASAAVILLGLVLYLVTGTSGYDGNAYPVNPLQILAGAAGLKPYAIILTGLLVLVSSPFLRVGVSIIVFLKAKDWLYVGITTFVFLVLIVSLILGKTE